MARIGGAGRFFRGLAGGAAASVAVGSLVLVKNLSGLAGGADVIGVLAELVGSGYRIDGWLTLLIGGSLLGVAFAYVKQWFSGSLARRALLFALSTWAAAQMILIAAAQSGALMQMPGVMLAAVFFVLFLIYGLVLGTVYGGLQHINFASRRRSYITLDTAHFGTRTDA